MRLLPLALPALILLSGCLGGTSVVESDGHRYETSCVNGQCEFCLDGECVPCSGGECDECMESQGDCAAMRRGAPGAGVPARAEDFDAQETHDLAAGLPETEWGFDVAPGAAGHVRIVLSDPVARQATVMASACFRYSIEGPSGSSDGSHGDCSGGNVVVGGSTNPAPRVIADWDQLRPGRYVLTLEAPPQANRVAVDIHVDNP
jgi:hypothetical protein